MRLLVTGYRLVSYDYFMNQLQPWEVPALLDSIPTSDRAQWEQTRLRIYATAAMFSKSEITVKDVMRLPWDTDDQPDTEPPTDSELQRLKDTANQLQSLI